VDAVRGALGLLTRIPIGAVVPDRPGAAAFGIVGAAVGGIGAIPLVVLSGVAGEPWLGAIAAVAVMALTTGALHLDGLADTADALLARDPEAAERARKDPAIGPGGAIALGLVLAAEVAALASMGASAAPVAGGALIAVAATSRVVPVVATRLARTRPTPTAPGGGLARWFHDGISTADAAVATASAGLVVIGVSLLVAAAPGSAAGWLVGAGASTGLVIGLVATAAIVALRGGLDGDGLGAAIEASMVAGLSATAVLLG
jgi:adenosylcobinamide-GDP ribazoletransferase